jgi:hypothetical protein
VGEYRKKQQRAEPHCCKVNILQIFLGDEQYQKVALLHK